MRNKVELIGYVGGNAQLKHTNSKEPVVSLSLATSEAWKDKTTGERREETEWHRVVFFGRLAEVVAEYVKKGQLILIDGRIKTRKYEADGVEKWVTEIIASKMTMFPKQKEHTAPAPESDNIPLPAYVPSNLDDDVPF